MNAYKSLKTAESKRNGCILVIGSPGTGKSQAVKRCAANLDLLFKDLNLSGLSSSNLAPLCGEMKERL